MDLLQPTPIGRLERNVEFLLGPRARVIWQVLVIITINEVLALMVIASMRVFQIIVTQYLSGKFSVEGFTGQEGHAWGVALPEFFKDVTSILDVLVVVIFAASALSSLIRLIRHQIN